MRRAAAQRGEARRLLSSVGLSAASAVQVFILWAGLAEVHERGVCLESSATCRTTREVNLPAAVGSGTVHARLNLKMILSAMLRCVGRREM